MITLCRTLVLASLAVSAGCHSYVATPVETLEPGMDVRVRVTEPMNVDLSNLTVRNVVWMDGRMVRWSGDGGIQLWGRRLQAVNGVSHSVAGDLLRVPPASVEFVQTQRTDRTKTGLLTAAAAGAVIGVLAILASKGNSLSGQGGGGTGGVGSSLIPAR